MQKFENGEHIFSGENAIATLPFGGIELCPWITACSRIGKENFSKIRDVIIRKYRQLKEKDPRAFSIIDKAQMIYTIDNFLSVYENGTFTPEKFDLLEKLVSENPNILKNINFRIFEDDIYSMGEEQVSRIARYPNISNSYIKFYHLFSKT